MRDPYSVLGVKRDAGPDEIKAAWRTKAKTAHPDQNQDDPTANNRFAEIGHAYDILKDPKKRSRFDARLKRAEGGRQEQTFQQKREAAREAAERAKAARANAEKVMEELARAEAARKAQQKPAGQTAGVNATPSMETPEEVISRIFGVPPGQQPPVGGQPSPGHNAAGASAAYGVNATATQTARSEPAFGDGETAEAARPNSLPAQAIDLLTSLVRRIRGTAPALDKAPDVAAIATVTVDYLMKLNWITVPLPDGKDGRFQIEPGAGDGDVIKLRNQGLKLQGLQRGDVAVTLRVDPNGPFRVQGSDVITALPVNLQNAVLGWTTVTDSPTGPVEVVVPAWSGSDQTIRIPGLGLPKAGGGKGDLVVEIRLVLWEKPDDKVTDLMRSMREGLYL